MEVKDYSVRNFTVVEIPKSLHQELKPYATSKGQSVKAMVIQAIQEFLNKEKEVV